MILERSKNTKRNVFFGFIDKIISLMLPFIIRTIIIKKLGADYLGLNGLFTSILQVLSLTELGFSSAIIFNMYEPIAHNDVKTIQALMNFYRKVYKIIGCIIVVIGVFLLPFLKYLIHGKCPSDLNIYALYLLYLLNTSISYFLFAYKEALLIAHQRNDIVSKVHCISQGMMYVAQIVILCTFQNYYLYLITMPIFSIIYNLLNSHLADKFFPEYFCKGKLSTETKSVICNKVSGLMINKLCQVSRNSFDSIFVSAFLGLKITAMYSNYYYIMNAIIGIMSIFSSAMIAGVGNSIVVETTAKNYKDLKKINFIYMWICGWCTICLACLYQPFMKLWVGKSLMFDYPIVALFCIYFYALKMGDIRGMYSDAAGLWWENRYRAIIEALTNVVLNYVLAKYMGIYGILLATLISLIIINFGFGSQIVFKYYFKNNELCEYFKLTFCYAFVTLITYFITAFVCMLFTVDGLVGLVIKGIICIIVPNVAYFVIYRKTKEYAQAIPWLLQKLHIENSGFFSFLIRK